MKSHALALAFALLTASTVASFSAQAAGPAATILADYQSKATPLLEKLNATLTKQGSVVAADFISKGDTASAEEVTAQIKQKTVGALIPRPHPALSTLLAQYDGARETLLKPVQTAAIAKIDAALKSSAGKDMTVVTELGKAREEILAGKMDPASSTAATSVPRGQNFLKANRIPTKWGYYLSSQYDKRYGTVLLDKDGTIAIEAASPSTGTWTPTADPTILALDLKNVNGSEKTEIIIKGDEATMKRVSGLRYLKAD